jgi:hypothetical protein
MTEMVTCRRGPERQAGAARPDLMDAPTLPSAQPLKHLPSRQSEPWVPTASMTQWAPRPLVRSLMRATPLSCTLPAARPAGSLRGRLPHRRAQQRDI